MSEAVRRCVRAAVNQAWGKKPICSVLLTVLPTTVRVAALDRLDLGVDSR